jgi:hypothetical protein
MAFAVSEHRAMMTRFCLPAQSLQNDRVADHVAAEAQRTLSVLPPHRAAR